MIDIFLQIIVSAAACLSLAFAGAAIYRRGFCDGQTAKNGPLPAKKTLIEAIKNIPRSIEESKAEKEAREKAAEYDAAWARMLSYTGEDDEERS